MMGIEVREVGPGDLRRYGEIPTSFMVKSILSVCVADEGFGGIVLREEEVAAPYLKDYDACEDGRPDQWAEMFDVSRWAFFMAFDEDRAAGGAAVAFDTPEVQMLDGRKDLVVLWDIRVRPEHRRRGVGSMLFQRAADWAREKGCKQLKVETQNINVGACRFYRKEGCTLGAVNLYGYHGCPEAAGETMLLWYLDL